MFLLFSLIFVSVSVSMHEVTSGMAKEFITMKEDFLSIRPNGKVREKNLFWKT